MLLWILQSFDLCICQGIDIVSLSGLPTTSSWWLALKWDNMLLLLRMTARILDSDSDLIRWTWAVFALLNCLGRLLFLHCNNLELSFVSNGLEIVNVTPIHLQDRLLILNDLVWSSILVILLIIVFDIYNSLRKCFWHQRTTAIWHSIHNNILLYNWWRRDAAMLGLV